MRKFIAAGIGSLTLAASALAFTAGPAAAAPIIPGVCDALNNGMLSTANAAKAAADVVAADATVSFGQKDTSLNAALSDYVNAAIAYLVAVDTQTGTAVTLAKSVLDSKTTDVGQKASEWSTARVALYNAQNQQFAATWNANALNQLNGGICAS